MLAARIFTEAPRRARRAAWATGLVVAIAAAFVPLIWVVAVLAALLAAVVFRRAGRGMLLNLGITAVVPPILLLPWTLRRRDPAGAALPGGREQGARAGHGRPCPPGRCCCSPRAAPACRRSG